MKKFAANDKLKVKERPVWSKGCYSLLTQHCNCTTVNAYVILVLKSMLMLEVVLSCFVLIKFNLRKKLCSQNKRFNLLSCLLNIISSLYFDIFKSRSSLLKNKQTNKLFVRHSEGKDTQWQCSQSKQQRLPLLSSVFIIGMWCRGKNEMSKGCRHHNQPSQRWEHVSSEEDLRLSQFRMLCSNIFSFSLSLSLFFLLLFLLAPQPPPASPWANRPFPSASAISKCQSKRRTAGNTF